MRRKTLAIFVGTDVDWEQTVGLIQLSMLLLFLAAVIAGAFVLT